MLQLRRQFLVSLLVTPVYLWLPLKLFLRGRTFPLPTSVLLAPLTQMTVFLAALSSPGWTVTKTFQYLVHPVQSSKSFLGVVLKGLKVKRARDSDWLDMEPEAGQCVVVGDRRFTLVLCMQIGRGYRVWVTGDEGCFTAQAKDVVDVFPLTGSDKTTALQRRLEVLTFFIVVPHAYTYILCCRCSKEQRRCRRVTCLRGEDTRTPASANPVF
jgi:hypothetical protein